MSLEIIECNGYCRNNSGEEFFRDKIKRLYQNEKDSEAILYIQPLISGRIPDFILIDKNRGVAILEIKDWGPKFLYSINSLEVKTADGNTMQNPARQCLRYYYLLKKMFKDNKVLCDENDNLKYKIIPNLIMYNMTDNDLEKVKYFFNKNEVEFIYKNMIRYLTLNDIFKNSKENINDNAFDFMRCIINPEIRISENYRHHRDYEINYELSKLIKVLDLEQEKFAKRNINGHYMVSGVPGSGKTIMLITRALHIAKLHKDWNIKIVCYNNSLVNKIKEKLNFIDKDFGLDYSKINKDKISISTFHSLCSEFTKISRDEMLHYGEEDYFKKILPIKALRNVRQKYDAVLVDEYQDFYDNWLKLCIACCKKHNNKENLFLAGDRIQSIYNSKENSWKSLGINIQGRSKLLKRSYRLGKNFINTALEFLKHDAELSEEINKFYEGSNNIRTNDVGFKIKFITGYYNKIVEQMLELFRFGYKPSDILILVLKNSDIDKVRRMILKNIKNFVLLRKLQKEIKYL